jgi:hypothetical protein
MPMMATQALPLTGQQLIEFAYREVSPSSWTADGRYLALRQTKLIFKFHLSLRS